MMLIKTDILLYYSINSLVMTCTVHTVSNPLLRDVFC